MKRAAKRTSTRPSLTDTAKVRAVVNLNDATFEQLRLLGMSVTQATRVIAYRERQDGFESIEDINSVPGLPNDLLAELKERLSV